MSLPTGVQLLKQELRKQIRSSLAKLSPASIASESAQTVTRFLSSEVYQKAKSIAIYASMAKEFDTSLLLADAFNSRKRVFLPRVVSKHNHEMVMIEVHSAHELETFPANNWGIREPPLDDGRAKTPEDEPVDLVVVPGLAFDVHGARCGQGMGFYDRYFQKCAASPHPMPRLVALTLSVQIVTSVPVTPSDWPVDEVIFAKTE